MQTIAVIPARGGSKGLPGKNLMTVGGHSLVARAVAIARESRSIGRVIVSSDDPDILRAGEAAGAEPLARPARLASDDATTLDVVLHALAGATADVVVILQPTSPLRVVDDVDSCVQAVATGRATTATTVTELAHPVEWTFTRDEAGRLTPLSGWASLPRRRQEAASNWSLNGAVYAALVDRLRAGHQLLDEDTFAVPMPRERSVDVDSVIDLELCRVLAAQSEGRGP